MPKLRRSAATHLTHRGSRRSEEDPRPPWAALAPASDRPDAVLAPLSEGYRRREPEKTVLHEVVEPELPGFLGEARERSGDGDGLPRFVKREFEAFLDFGVLSRGFCREVCPSCGHEVVVGLSCKGRGFCPSCTARRMADTAAHRVDRVLPVVPYRQWVLAFARRHAWSRSWNAWHRLPEGTWRYGQRTFTTSR